MNQDLSSNASLHLEKEYVLLLTKIKDRFKVAQLRAAKAVNSHVIRFYWQLGEDILQIQSIKKHWGSKLLDQLSKDLQTTHPEMSGFSRRSLEYMRLLTKIYPDFEEFTQQAAAQLPWSVIQLLLDKFKDDSVQRDWYAKQTLEHGWSRPTLNTHIKTQLYERQGIDTNKASNYREKLPSPQSDLAQEMLKNPYNFDFLSISKEAHEREIENALTTHIKNFLLELGSGFSFVGTQVPLDIDGEAFYIDALFYHYKLRCFVVCEIKAKRFKPADVGQLSFYLAAVDGTLKHPDDNPSIGILLCESRSKVIAEYALKNINVPIGVSEYTLAKALPKELKVGLPTIEEIETELNEVVENDTSEQK